MEMEEKHEKFRKSVEVYFSPASFEKKFPEPGSYGEINRRKNSNPELADIYYEVVKSSVKRAESLSELKKVLQWAHAPDLVSQMTNSGKRKKYGVHDRGDVAKAVMEKVLSLEIPKEWPENEYLELHSFVISPYFPQLHEKKSYKEIRKALMDKENKALWLIQASMKD
ncbi:hypothetical protein ACFLQ2_04795 [archaeon]